MGATVNDLLAWKHAVVVATVLRLLATWSLGHDTDQEVSGGDGAPATRFGAEDQPHQGAGLRA